MKKRAKAGFDVYQKRLRKGVYGNPKVGRQAFALEADRLGFILTRVKPKTLKLVSAVTLAKRSAIKCRAEDEMKRE